MKRLTFINKLKINKGATLILILVFTSIFVILITAGAGYVTSQMKIANQRVDKERAYQIAEAGINYYRWHLAHVPADFQDGTGAAGPYVHDYKDSTGATIGQYSLNIIPPATGSTVVTIESTGWVSNRPSLKRKLVENAGIPSFTQYAVVADDIMRFGTGTEVFGPIHSNNGIRFDGIAHNLITSAKASYNDPDSDACTVNSWGVHTCVNPYDPSPPTALPNRPDVFMAGRQCPVPQVDFNGITANLATLKTAATNNGIYLGPSGAQGYHIHFNTNQTVDIQKVSTQLTCQYCYSNCTWQSNWSNYADVFSIDQQASFTYQTRSSIGLPMPTNGIIFAGDDIWIDGQINNSHVTVVAAREPLASGSATIIINNDLRYTYYDGRDVIGLIAQTDISVGFYSEDDLQIDAALIAQNGRAGRYYYDPHSGAQFSPANCDDYVSRQKLTLNGSIATNQRYGFAYTGTTYCGGTESSGYCTRTLNFDQHLTFGPPPSFPTTGQYTIISLEEQ